MANNNFVVKNGLTVNGSFTANSTAVNASAITATSVNAATLSISGSSVATLITSNAATAYTNATSYTDTKSAAAYTNATTFAANATNITNGTLPDARLSSAIVNTSGSFTIGGPITFSNVVTFSNTIAANGSNGTSGQVLTSSGPSGNVYWSTVSLGVNTSAAFSWTNSHIFSNTVTVNASTLSVGNTVANTTVTLGTITISNGAAVATVNATVYSGTANNAASLSGVSLTTIQSQITGNSATAYSNAVANAAALYQTMAGLSANVTTLTSNNALYLGGTIASGYQTTAGLSANVATLTSNNSTNFGGVSLTTVQSQITGNAATAYSNATTYSSNAAVLSSGTVPTARLASGTANSSTYLRGDQTWATTGTVTSVATGTGLTGGPVTGTGTISLATAGAGAATYSSGISAITVDAYGRVSSVSGSAGYVTSSGVTSVATGTGLTGGPITSTGTLSLAAAGSGAATYSSGISSITVDAYGRVTSVSGSAGYVTSSGYGYGSNPTFGSIVATNETRSGSFVATSSTYYLNTSYGVYMNYDGSTFINFSNNIRVPAAVQIGGGEYGAKNLSYTNSARTVTLYLDASGNHGLADNSGGFSRWYSPNNGDFNVYGSYYSGYSDSRLKKNIKPISDALYKVNRINGVTFNMNDLAASFGFKDSKTFVGVLAEEIEAVLPEAVAIAPFDADHKDDMVTSKSGENYKTVQYEKIVPLLIEAIKELNNKTDEALAAKDVTINSLKTNIADLQAQINLLKK